MNKFFLKSLIVCFSLGFVFAGCDDGEDGNSGGIIINASVQNGSEYNTAIDHAKALLDVDEEYNSEDRNFYWSGYTTASGQYSNGGFTMTLPETVSGEYLYSPEFEEGVMVSDANAKMGDVYFVADKSDIQVGEFFCLTYAPGDDVTSGCQAFYVYADKEFSITGEYERNYGDEYMYKYTYNMTLKEGWNIVYRTFTMSGTTRAYVHNNTASSGMKWYFHAYYSYSADKVKTSKSVDYKRESFSPFKRLN